MSGELKVYDAEMEGAGIALVGYGNRLISMIEDYVKALTYVTNHAIQDDAIATQLLILAEDVEKIKAPIAENTEAIEKMCTEFIEEIDKADQFLY